MLHTDHPQGTSYDHVPADPRILLAVEGSRLKPSELSKLFVDPVKYQVERSKKKRCQDLPVDLMVLG